MTIKASTFIAFTRALVIIALTLSIFSGLGIYMDAASLLDAQSTAERQEMTTSLAASAIFQEALAMTAAYGEQSLVAQLVPSDKARGG